MGKPRRVLIAEDEDLFRQALAMSLELHGFEITEARNGLEAVQRLAPLPAHEPFDVLVTDARMPFLGGLELAGEAKKMGRPPVVILITGFSDMGSRKSVPPQVDAVISKPFELEVLLATIFSLLDP